jgi:tRNA(Ile)-lysidine synthase
LVCPICENFENTVSATLKSYPVGTIFLAAVSGGADSMAMLTALINSSFLISNFSLLKCLHVEHGLRPAEESRGDADFVFDYCKKNGIECFVVHIKPGKIAAFAKRKGIGIEAAARFFRHKALRLHAEQLGENTAILTGHTKDDLLETALMRVLRGSGPAGLAVMPKKRGRFVRPLLAKTRADVIGYLTAKGISWREDATNTDEMFLRNKVRKRLVPLLDEAFPSWKAGVDAMANTQSLTADFIAEEAKKRIKWAVLPESSFTETKNFFAQPQIIREEAVFQAIDEMLKNKKNFKSIKRSVIRKFCSGAAAVDLGAVRVKQEGEKIIVSFAQKEFFECGISRMI